MRYDLHIHGEFSSDSTIIFEDLIKKAIASGYSQIACTEHFDYLPSESIEYGLPSYVDYVQHIETLKERYKDSITILPGAEIGECHRVTDYLAALYAYRRPEIVIGSIHVLANGKNASVPLDTPFTRDDIIDYYEENLALVEQSEMDILGHLGIYKRYMTETPDESFVQKTVDKILETLIRREIALEVNYSPLRKPYTRPLAEYNVVSRYLSLGGRLVTIGSDSHDLSQFNDYYGECVSALQECSCTELARFGTTGLTTFPIGEAL